MPRRLIFVLLQQLIMTALIPLIFLGGAVALLLLPLMKQEQAATFDTIAVAVSDQIETYLDSAEEQLKMLAQDFMADPRSSNLSNRLKGIVQTSNIFGALYTTFPDGRIQTIGLKIPQVGTEKLFLGMRFDISEQQIQALEPGKFAWSNVYISPITGLHTIRLHIRIGDFLLAGEVDIKKLPALSARLSKHGYLVLLLDSKANLIAHPDPIISKQNLNMRFASLFSESTDQIRTGSFLWNRYRYQATVVPMPEFGWQVVVSQPASQFHAAERNITFIWVILTGITLLLTIFVAFLIAKRESGVFEKLTQTTRQIAKGGYKVDPVSSKVSEYQMAADAIFSLAKEVNDREQQLKLLNSELEQRVNERTEELSKTNQELNYSLQHLKNTQEQLVQSEKLASLGSLVAGIAHELNTPIGNAKIAISSQFDFHRPIAKAITEQTLTRTQLEQFVDDIHSTSDIAYRNLGNALDLIQSFKQVAVDQSSSKQRQFNLAKLINEVLVTLQPTLKKQPVTVETDIPKSIVMQSAPGPISQILTNLINNAIFHGMDGKAQLHIQIRAELKNHLVLLTFHDNGIGMSEESVHHAFDPFYTTKFGQGGSGLGLSIVHKLTLQLLRGNVRLTSEKGHGTTFYLELPVDINQINPIETP